MIANPLLADIDFEVIEDVVVIYDLDKGGRSVTNDIREVLRFVDAELGGLGKKTVIYRDSNRTFDGVYHNGAAFVGFYPIGEQVLERAFVRCTERANVIDIRTAH